MHADDISRYLPLLLILLLEKISTDRVQSVTLDRKADGKCNQTNTYTGIKINHQAMQLMRILTN